MEKGPIHQACNNQPHRLVEWFKEEGTGVKEDSNGSLPERWDKGEGG